MAGGAWTELDMSLGPNNHGPTFAPITETWVPEQVGDALTWQGRSETFLDQGELFFSSQWPSGGAGIFEFEEALLTSTRPCLADWNGDGVVDIHSFFAFLDDFAAGEPRADLNEDGEVDVHDLFIYLDFFEKGCP